jgi:parallel beta-helix repeat protein
MNRRQLIKNVMGGFAATVVLADVATVRPTDRARVGTFANPISPSFHPEIEATGTIEPKVHVVATAAQLTAALNAASPGTVIVLAPGQYGDFTITGKNYSNYVTIQSQTPKAAVFTSFAILNSGFIRVDGIHVSSPNTGFAGGWVATVQGSNNIQFVNSEVNAFQGNPNATLYYGLYFLNCQTVLVDNNHVHDCQYGILVFSTSNPTVTNNTVDNVKSVTFKFGDVSNFLIADNFHGGHIFPDPPDHCDFIQFQSTSHDGVIRGNVLLPQNSAFMQGIFVADGNYTNITIEQNIIYTGMGTGIFIEGSNNIVRNNTVLNAPGLVHKGTWIQIIGRATESMNIQANVAAVARITANEIIAQHTNPNGVAYYNKLFKNARRGLGVTFEDLRPVPGSPADFGSGMGAEQRLYQLLNP